jgi:hypothetical protein
MRRRELLRGLGLLAAVVAAGAAGAASAGSGPASPPPVQRSSPHQGTSGQRPVLASDRGAPVALPAGVTLVDTVVSNTDPNLNGTDTAGDSEPSLAVDPADPSRVVAASFSGCWVVCPGHGGRAPDWTSTDGGAIWTKNFMIAPPRAGQGVNGCPCDQTPDFDRSHDLFQTFLTEGTFLGFVYTGDAPAPPAPVPWEWHVTNGVADITNAEGRNADQPWLLVNRDPANPSQDDAYVGYDDFGTSPVGEYVAVSYGAAPPSFTVDRSVGIGPGCCVNPGLRLAVDRSSGAVYALWEQATFNNSRDPKIKIQYMLNRSTDGGQTWTLNGKATGIQIANVPSDQVFNANTGVRQKFGTVNALFGGIDHAAVDSATGDVYYVYGVKDTATGNNRLAAVRLTPNDQGGLDAGPPVFVTGQVQAALPSVAVASDGTVGVLYDTFDGFDQNGFPLFTVHIATSADHGASFSDLPLLPFTSPFKDNGNDRQRILGDYQQLKAVGRTFFGIFTANGATLGRPFANMDAIFVKGRLASTVTSGGPAASDVLAVQRPSR